MSVLIIVCLYSYVTNIRKTCFVCSEGPPKPLGKQKVKRAACPLGVGPFCYVMVLKIRLETTHWLGAPALIPLSLFPAATITRTGMKHALLILAPLSFQILPWHYSLRILFLLFVFRWISGVYMSRFA